MRISLPRPRGSSFDVITALKAAPETPLRRRLVGVFDYVVGMLLLFLGWGALALYINNLAIFPAPASVVATGVEMIRQGELWEDVYMSLSRIAVGYLLGTVVGIAGGLTLGRVELARRFLSPIINSVRTLPPVALIPLAIIWFGIGEESKYFIVFWGSVMAVLFNTMDGVRNTPRNRVLAAACLGASQRQIAWDVVIPSAIPAIWTGMKLAVGLAFMGVVAAELIAARSGLGALIMDARTLVQTDKMFVGLATLAVVGGFVDLLVSAFGDRVLHRYIAYVRA
ncbi:MAG TPA: ABC transporter permease [Gemmatimonadaceae bacterium]|nr:ABC transporter permease [Gemmatimonadaceae bacterium]